MCGFVQRVNKGSVINELLNTAGLPELTLNEGDFYPGGRVDIILSDPVPRSACSTWWFLLGEGGKPNYKYTTFNARRLDGRMWKSPLKHTRCLIPATAFGESIGEGKAKRSYLLESDGAFFLGGLYRHYETEQGTVTSFAVITCNPHPRLSKYHDKACPLFLPPDPKVISDWLDPNLTGINHFQHWIDQPVLTTNFQVTPVLSTKKLATIGPAERLSKDTA